METFTRTNKATGEKTTLPYLEAVDQLIRDNYEYEYLTNPEDIGNVEDWLNDMSTVFESRSLLEDTDEYGLDAGDFIYTKN